MGRAARWLRGLLGGRKSDSSVGTTPEASRQPSEKKRWGFGKSFREKEKTAQQKQPTRAAAAARAAEDRKVSYREAADQEEESKRAIAVAAATAAVAEAAVAAAQAAAAVVRLTSSGRCVGFGKREEWAAVKIQSTFRGYLARRALKALKGLVKLQALVRGNIVRKQAAETLRCMQALVRVQARARACRAIRSERVRPEKPSRSHPGPPTPEKYEHSIRTNGSKSDRSGSLVRNSSKSAGADANDRERSHSSGWNWLDRWIEERYWNNQEATSAAVDDDKSAKILEVDPGKPQFNSKRRSNHNNNHNHIQSSCSNSRSFATVPDSPSKDSTTAQLSIRSPSTVDMRQSLSPLMFPAEIGESPQYYSATSRPGSSSRRGPFTPSKSECSRSLFGFSDYPSYMANTESSRAKVRSQSAPKQRPLEYEKSGSVKRLSVAPAQKSNTLHVKFTNKAYPGSGRLDRLGMPVRY